MRNLPISVGLTMGFLHYAASSMAADEIQKKSLHRSLALRRVCDLIEDLENITQYTANPPTVVIRIDETDTITITGNTARRAYEMLQRKKQAPSKEEALADFQKFSNQCGEDGATCKQQ